MQALQVTQAAEELRNITRKQRTRPLPKVVLERSNNSLDPMPDETGARELASGAAKGPARQAPKLAQQLPNESSVANMRDTGAQRAASKPPAAAALLAAPQCCASVALFVPNSSMLQLLASPCLLAPGSSVQPLSC